MALKEELEQQGNWLFRWRSYLPLLMLPLLLAPLLDRDQAGRISADQGWKLFCLTISLLGLALRFYAVGHVPKGTSGRNVTGQRADRLNTSGIYSVVRHPLYLGNGIIWLGAAMFSRVVTVPVIMALLFWVYYERIMLAEEEFLRRKYGEAFIAWANATPAFLPRLGGWRRWDLPFQIRTALKREYSGFFGIVVTFTAMEAVTQWMATGRLRLDPLWTGIFCAGLAVYLLLMALKKTTRVLYVEGR